MTGVVVKNVPSFGVHGQQIVSSKSVLRKLWNLLSIAVDAIVDDTDFMFYRLCVNCFWVRLGVVSL